MILVPNKIFDRLEGETEEQYIWRVCNAKDAGIIDANWDVVSDMINRNFREDESEYRNECVYRKSYQNAKRFYDAGVFNDGKDKDDATEKKILELQKLKQQIRDERADYQRTVRQQARSEAMIEAFKRIIDEEDESGNKYSISPDIASLLSKNSWKQVVKHTDKDMIICLSDLHIGLAASNYWNEYNTQVLYQTLDNYFLQICEIQKQNGCEYAYVTIGGDLISGIIHENLRLENTENVIRQMKIATEAIGEFLAHVSTLFKKVEVYSVAGNHSRVSPLKSAHQKGENLDEMVIYGLHLMFKNCDSVVIHQADDAARIDESIAAFTTENSRQTIALIHGDKDNVDGVAKRITMMCGIIPNMIIMGHRHTNQMETQQGVKVINCGCLSGMDNYCVDNRLVNYPEQVVIISSILNPAHCVYNIRFPKREDDRYRYVDSNK